MYLIVFWVSFNFLYFYLYIMVIVFFYYLCFFLVIRILNMKICRNGNVFLLMESWKIGIKNSIKSKRKNFLNVFLFVF